MNSTLLQTGMWRFGSVIKLMDIKKKELKSWKCWVTWLFVGHSKEAEGSEVHMVHCNGCNSPVFIKNR